MLQRLFEDFTLSMDTCFVIVFITVISLGREVVECLSAFSFLFMWDQQFSIGSKSGELPGQASTVKLFYISFSLFITNAILEEEVGAMDLHKGQQVVFQDSFVALTVHRLVLGEQ
jgi:hypothetical protein